MLDQMEDSSDFLYTAYAEAQKSRQVKKKIIRMRSQSPPKHGAREGAPPSYAARFKSPPTN